MQFQWEKLEIFQFYGVIILQYTFLKKVGEK